MDCGFTDAMKSLGEKTANFFESKPDDTEEPVADAPDKNVPKNISDTENSITNTTKTVEKSLINGVDNTKDNIDETKNGITEEVVKGSDEPDYKFVDTIPQTVDEAIESIREDIVETGKDME